jgi:hypothetical protein
MLPPAWTQATQRPSRGTSPSSTPAAWCSSADSGSGAAVRAVERNSTRLSSLARHSVGAAPPRLRRSSARRSDSRRIAVSSAMRAGHATSCQRARSAQQQPSRQFMKMGTLPRDVAPGSAGLQGPMMHMQHARWVMQHDKRCMPSERAMSKLAQPRDTVLRKGVQ